MSHPMTDSATYLFYGAESDDAVVGIFDDGDGANALVPPGRPAHYVTLDDLPPAPAARPAHYDTAVAPSGLQGTYVDAMRYVTPPPGAPGVPSLHTPPPVVHRAAMGGPAAPPPPPALAPPPITPPPPPGKPASPFNARQIGTMGTVRELRHLGTDHHYERRGAVDPGGTMGTVRYLDAVKRRKYEVTMGAKILRTETGAELDTPTIYEHYKTTRPNIGSFTLGTRRDGTPFRQLAEWRRSALIWVCAVDEETDRPRFYTHVCRIHKFHHSSFAAGAGVIGAGEWVVRGGKLRAVSANSGHYRPDLSNFYNAVLHMAQAFRDGPEGGEGTQVLMYDRVDDQWVHRPVKQFIAAPSGNGRYFTHPSQVAAV
ncbi:hypothetical protein [Roseisolibacter agri]|uniref:Uncharacterized protein n=1 Tax=Roseisolibacter agri TaxID=2014610 RepID=A0AA37V8C6_9BACT|nr:hypothetical protein [Roseisolibacter agri]GLC27626.1 hypothetical protein rosag_41390 [Roseisolibacter agri]